MIKFTDAAKTKVKEFIEQSQKEGMALRISVTNQREKGFSYQFGLEHYSQEKPSDLIIREGGFATRLDPESAKWLQNATIDWATQGNQPGFAVDNPNNPIPPENPEELKETIIEVLRTIYDPEIPVNIYELGLVYNVDIDENKKATVKMTLTSPNCPVAESLPAEVVSKVKAVPGIEDAAIDLTWEPPWNMEMMSEEARLTLNL